MSPFTYPAELAIQPSQHPPNVTVSVPGSKSITNRALVLAALAQLPDGCTLTGVLRSEDTYVMIDSLRRLGFLIQDNDHDVITLRAPESLSATIPATTADLWVENSGTTMRFLTALVSLGPGTYRLDGIARMRERPIADLLDALTQLGVDARCEQRPGFPPVVISGQGWRGRDVRVRGDVSSQFLSGLMLAAAGTCPQDRPFRIHIDGPLVSVPYVDMTIGVMRAFGLEAAWEDSETIRIGGAWPYKPRQYPIEPDASAASYFFAAAAITRGRVTVTGMTPNMLQGDVRFVELLQAMGCRVESCEAGMTVHGGELQGIEVDMNAISDTVMTLAAVALFAKSPTTIRNVAHIRHKETDRLTALAVELRKLGAVVEELSDGLRITPGPLQGATLDTYNDHRMAMSLALVGLKVPGVVIRNPGCVAKTYPVYWQDFARLR